MILDFILEQWNVKEDVQSMDGMVIHLFLYTLILITGGSDGKASACNAGDLGLIPGLGRSPGGGNGNPLQYSCMENLHGQRRLVGYSPGGRQILDTAEVTEHTCIYVQA